MSFISQITLPNNNSYNFKDKLANVYATCSSAANETEKVVTIANFENVIGQTIHITFLYENSAVAPALKINDLTAQLIYLNNGNINLWNANETVAFTWDGNYWRLNNYDKIEVIRL